MITSINVYCDESSVENTNTKFMVIGALVIPRVKKKSFLEEYKNITREHNFSELKWTKISKASLPLYKKIIDLFFDKDYTSFYSIIVNKQQVDLKTYHNNDNELAFYKFYYLLLKEKLASNSKYYICLDKKPVSVKSRVGVLKNFLKAFVSSSRTDCVIKHVQEYSSKENSLIQMADIFTGVVASKFNQNTKNIEKLELIKYIENKIGRQIDKQSSLKEHKFNTFIWKPSV